MKRKNYRKKFPKKWNSKVWEFALLVMLLVGNISLISVSGQQNNNEIASINNDYIKIEILELNNTHYVNYWMKTIPDNVKNASFTFENSITSTSNVSFELQPITGGINHGGYIGILQPGNSTKIESSITHTSFFAAVISYIISLEEISKNATIRIKMEYDTQATNILGLQYQSLIVLTAAFLLLIRKRIKK